MLQTQNNPDARGVQRRIFTVARLNQELQRHLEQGFGPLWVEAELSNLSRPASGHWYFSLKDNRAQIRCAMFRTRNRYLTFEPAAGDQVLVRGKPAIYEARGDLQLIVEHMEPAGAGRLQAAFEAIRARLDAAGWFAAEARQALPATPATVGVITSPTSAAVRDVLQVLRRRYPQAQVIVYPTPVQGAGSVPGIVDALQRAARHARADVLLLVRGGGSLEDLWAFNEEAVAAAIRACPLPVVTGVGHEVDITIADLVADLRAPTPSAAAELATPDGAHYRQSVQALGHRLSQAMQRRLALQRGQQTTLAHRLQAQHPEKRLRERAQRLDDWQTRLQAAMQWRLERRSRVLEALAMRVQSHAPHYRMARLAAHLEALRARLGSATTQRLDAQRHRWALAARALDSVSPLATVQRGYALVETGQGVVSDVRQLVPGQRITTRLRDGRFDSEVLSIQQKCE